MWLEPYHIRGRSKTLRVNYRTSHQIRAHADRLLPHEVTDVDGIVEERGGTVSVFNGPPPSIKVVASQDEEAQMVAEWVKERTGEGVLAHEVGTRARDFLIVTGVAPASEFLDDLG